ncbi:hypothetical protein [Streptomyces triticiradicis]|uniref:Uncharacterized protein n=1 Tax=Streptomyces triticiradicis TaxID=2651189 RepID=A0A7J5D3I8_9ACTN|nr:hypothetical protein [Streptomyces triticiradicis]KAB1976802.1 hypothetical protein F8144_43445 [Streptomyces triticiradicis]
MSSGLVFRLARAAVFAAVCVTVTSLGHALMSQGVPARAVGYGFAATTAGAWWLAGRRERGVLAVTGSTVAAQFALHRWFDFAQASAGPPAMPCSGAGMVHDASSAMGAMPMDGPMTSHWSLGMVAAHSLAAVLCGLWLWRGEAAVFRAGRALAVSVFAPLRRAERIRSVCQLPPPVRPARFFVPVLPVRGVLLRHDIARRGPPMPAVCC